MTAETPDTPNAPWVTREQILALPWFAELDDQSVALLDELADVASAWLWRASGRQYSCPADSTVRPVGFAYPGYGGRWSPTGISASTFDSRTGTFWWSRNWGRGEYAFETRLGHSPVNAITEVVIDGAIFDPSKYRLDDAAWLVRTDGSHWPAWQDWTKDSGVGPDRLGTWQVSLNWGANPPPDGVYAAAILAGELALAAANDDACRLPSRVQNILRQGTSMVLLDPSALLDANRWGIQEVDMFVGSVNPSRLRERASILSPDLPRVIRRAGTQPGS